MDTEQLIVAFAAAPLQVPLTDDIILEDHGQSMVYRGRAAVSPILRAYFSDGFPDGRMCIRTTFTNTQTAVIAFTFRGRQDGLFLGIPATSREVAVPMILLCRITDCHIQHIAWYYDAGTILRQLGLTI